MLISLNWLSDYVDLPDTLDPHALAEQFTLSFAEVEDVHHLQPGATTAADTVCALEDWVIEVDNKSITHRPDLWGHYGIAREMAALLRQPLKPLVVADSARLDNADLPAIEIIIDDPQRCRRYSGLRLRGVDQRSAPDWMQARLAHVGIRPLGALVDLTNYVMAELGQPMHAFDGERVSSIEVAVAKGGERFTTLDGVERCLPAGAVMIQSARQNVALAGIMGGSATEVHDRTTTILLESANFDAASVRRCASALGHRTEASARFEKSLDPALTVQGISRFVELAGAVFPELQQASRLGDCFPEPPEPLAVDVDPAFVSSFIGRNISFAEMKRILEAVDFKVADADDHVRVTVPSFRATKDIEGEADIIEEVARFVGYDQIPPKLPQATLRRFLPNAQQRIERRTLDVLCRGGAFYEYHDYNWYHEDWLKTLQYDPEPSIRLRNPAASGLERMRQSLVPSLLQAAELNRRTWPTVRLLNIGSVFCPVDNDDDVRAQQSRHLGLVVTRRQKQAEDALFDELKQHLTVWARETVDDVPTYRPVDGAGLPWEDPHRTATVHVAGLAVGRIASINLTTRRRIDDHFKAWAVAVAELDIGALAGHRPAVRKLPPVPSFPEVALDYAVLVDARRPYATLDRELAKFEHALLVRLSFEGSYEGGSIPAGQRSLLLRARIADPARTLQDEDIKGFAHALETFLTERGLDIRR